ncbi:hypothetical protein LC593_35870 [Nostoc sp. CHAB 5844]|nr:hypothetical protein [Nostoc sp. CHAB 5844]
MAYIRFINQKERSRKQEVKVHPSASCPLPSNAIAQARGKSSPFCLLPSAFCLQMRSQTSKR